MDKKENEEQKPKLTIKQKELMKKILVFTIMGLICAGSLYWIFMPSADKKAKGKAQAGFNTEIPMPKEAGLTDDKREAYEKESVKQTQAERMRSLSDFSEILGSDNSSKPKVDLSLNENSATAPATHSKVVGTAQKPTPVQKSVNAYKNINNSLGNFYEKSEKDPEKEDLKRQVDELKAQIDKSDSHRNEMDNQVALMEKSYQLAAKYMPGSTGATATATIPEKEISSQAKDKVSGKTTVAPVTALREKTVSCLSPEMSNAEFIENFSQPRNMGFLTAETDKNVEAVKNTISACISDNQTVMDGENVRLRLLEPIQAGKMVVPAGTCLSGTAKIQGERLFIGVYSIESTGQILPVTLSVYDIDGQAGIFIPDTKEINAVKEIAANMGTNSGTSINLSRSAGSQLVSDMGRNLIQGVSQFFSKKMREVKVGLKAGYRVFLVSSDK